MRRHAPGFAVRRLAAAFGAAVALIAIAPLEAQTERYVAAAVAASGDLQLQTADGRTITIAREAGQVGFDQIAISPDGTSVGWVGLQENCCSSYPVPTHLVIYRAGASRIHAGNGLPVWTWRFTNGGTHVAMRQETVHGGHGLRYELREVATGALVAAWTPEYGRDNRVLPDQTPPSWARELTR